jgi:SAM-dependent methyltransferase
MEQHAPRYTVANRQAWDHWARLGSISSQPVSDIDRAAARRLVDPDGWLPWAEIGNVLCLAAGGGQQGPAFAALGCAVTVVDSLGEQLAIDREVAQREGLDVNCIKGDMCELARLGIGGFDLVYQPISSCYVNDVATVHRQVRRVLRPHGLYRVEHWNPVHMRLWSAPRSPDHDYYRLQVDGDLRAPIVTTVSAGPAGEPLLESWTFPHTLTELIGTLCESGFVVRRLAEDCGGDAMAAPGTDEHLAAVVPPFFRMLARRLESTPASPGAMRPRP